MLPHSKKLVFEPPGSLVLSVFSLPVWVSPGVLVFSFSPKTCLLS